MIHKKQAHEQIERTIKWNKVRGNTPDTLNWPLEISMLEEEFHEIVAAVNSDDKVGIFDGLLDLKFVLLGTLGKMGLSAEDIVDGYEAVIKANETKSETKDSNGKITKPEGFVGPEATLLAILKN